MGRIARFIKQAECSAKASMECEKGDTKIIGLK